MFKNGQKWTKRSKIVKNCQNGQKWSKMVKMVKNGQKWSKMVKSTQQRTHGRWILLSDETARCCNPSKVFTLICVYTLNFKPHFLKFKVNYRRTQFLRFVKISFRWNRIRTNVVDKSKKKSEKKVKKKVNVKPHGFSHATWKNPWGLPI